MHIQYRDPEARAQHGAAMRASLARFDRPAAKVAPQSSPLPLAFIAAVGALLGVVAFAAFVI